MDKTHDRMYGSGTHCTAGSCFCRMNSRMIFALILSSFILCGLNCGRSPSIRRTENFCNNWKFYPGDIEQAFAPEFNDSGWRNLNLPHDWSIEGPFSPDHPSTPGGGALPGGIGWYRKTFLLPEELKDHCVCLDFDGIYMNSEIWINGQYLGIRPNGYISFRVDLTPHVNFGQNKNTVAVKVDNSLQPNSRWYSGSGIYRNVWLVTTDPVHVAHWGTFITTQVSGEEAEISIKTVIENHSDQDHEFVLKTTLYDPSGGKAAHMITEGFAAAGCDTEMAQKGPIDSPELWSIGNPVLYRAVSEIKTGDIVRDTYNTPFGIRTFRFDAEKGFFLNDQPVKIHGVCNHHDLGCLGSAVNVRALERQLEIMKAMGVNSIRTSHNPPAPELLQLCDRMGFIVMDEMFDMWKKGKNPYDFSVAWDAWHEKDLRDFIMRDRNHPSVMIWSIGNEILEQWDSTGIGITRELAAIVKEIDPSRPLTAGLNDPRPDNPVIRSGALDLIGFNYHHQDFESFPENFPGQKFIATETNSGLATRGHYDMPSDRIRKWPERWDKPFLEGNPDFTCSAYDNCQAPWGSTQEETWKIVRKHDFLSGIYIWTGIDYLGEPTPYGWPARSSYFGLVDLAGFPKDSYYFYQSEWTEEPMLHLFPHWNWTEGDTIDVWAYTNCHEAELFLNGKSMGKQSKTDDKLHLMWRLVYEPGILEAVGIKSGRKVLSVEVKTAGPAAKISMFPDRNVISADGRDLSFVTVRIEDRNGVLVPAADTLVRFEVSGEGTLLATDNGCQTSHELFSNHERRAFNGLCLAVIQSTPNAGEIRLRAVSEGLGESMITLRSK